MFVLTRRFNSVLVGNLCIRVVDDVVVWSKERCVGRYLARRRCFRPASSPLTPPAVVYVAVGRPKKLKVDAAVEVEDGVDMFNGFVKRGLWREAAQSFYAVVSDYVSRRHFYTAKMEVLGRLARTVLKEGGFYMAVERGGSSWEVTMAAAPGKGQRFKEAALEIFEKAEAVKTFSIGVSVDLPLDVYLHYEDKSYSTYSSPQRAVKPLPLTLATRTTP